MKERSARPWRRRIALLVAGFAVLGAVLLFLFRHEILPESSPYTRGARAALEAGCFGCHDRTLPVANPAVGEAVLTADARTVPGILDGELSAEELRQWIENGVSDRAARRASPDAPARLLHMPAFRDHLSAEQIDDLVAYLLLEQHRARRSFERAPGADASRWERAEHLARRAGCFACHGELGQGGIHNPDSHKGYVPGFQGVDFELLTHGGDRALVREWIAKGHSQTFVDQHLLSALAARTLAGQTIHMPAYENFLSAEQIDELVEYCVYLHSYGPMDRSAFERYVRAVSAREPAAPANPGPIDPPGDAPPARVDFRSQVAPILEASCVRCHGPEKQKSDYRLDRRDDALRGGELAQLDEVAAILPGDPDGSRFLRFVEALEEDEAAEVYPMPPKREERLPDEQIAILRAWIAQGAAWPDDTILQDRSGR